MSDWFWMWLSAFALTQAVETPIYAAALAFRSDPARRLTTCVAYGFLASLLTHPVVWWVIPELITLDRYALFFAVAEGFAVVCEALLMRALRLRHALLWALVANGASVLVGMALRHLIGWP